MKTLPASQTHFWQNGKISVAGKLWRLMESDERFVMTFMQRFELPEPVARSLTNRGIALESADSYLNPSLRDLMPDPLHLHDMDKAAKRLHQALTNNETITIWGDYDVDGATSTALLLRYFKMLGHQKIDFYIPDRLKEGYGPNKDGLDLLHKKGSKVIVTVDCGTTSFEPLDYAKSLGIDVIVIDHHVAEMLLPKAVAVVNPNRLDQESTCKNLAAVGVCFLLVVALNRLLRDNGFFTTKPEPDLLQLLDLVALGTVCDVMTLQGLNRAFVAQGLKVMKKRSNVGLRALADISGIQGTVDSGHLGFFMGPRVNAGGRVGESTLGADILSTDDELIAQDIAQKLNNYNTERQRIEADVLEQALEAAKVYENDETLVIAGHDWHPGVIGIVAGRLKDRYHKPTCVISVDEQSGKASCRSVSGFDLGTAVHVAKQTGLLIQGGGHAMAAGFTIEPDKIDAFRNYLNNALKEWKAKQIVSGIDPQEFMPCITADGLLTIEAVSLDLVKTLDVLAPYGMGNPAPKFILMDVTVIDASIVPSKNDGPDHIRYSIVSKNQSRLNGIIFKATGTPLGDALLASKSKVVQMIGSIKHDTWQGISNVKFQLEDMMI